MCAAVGPPHGGEDDATSAWVAGRRADRLGGGEAEGMVVNHRTTGDGSDIAEATWLARDMVAQEGMAGSLGAIKLGEGAGETFMGRDMGHGRDYSEQISAVVDTEVRALVENAHHEAREILVEYRDVLDELMLRLLDKETLARDELAAVFKAVVKRTQSTHPTGNATRPPVTDE